MCGRYSLFSAGRLPERFGISEEEVKQLKEFLNQENYNVAPGQIMPIVTEDEKGRKLERMKWGIPRVIGRDVHNKPKVKLLINTRDDKAMSGFWWKTVASRRCLIPANGFFEWDKVLDNGGKEQKVPYYFHPKEDDLFAFAGIWATWEDVEGKEWHNYSIITTEANKEMAAIHDRMPVILHQEDEASWLSPSHNDDRSAIEALLRPYEDGGLEMYEVSRDVNVTRNNEARLIYPLNSQ